MNRFMAVYLFISRYSTIIEASFLVPPSTTSVKIFNVHRKIIMEGTKRTRTLTLIAVIFKGAPADPLGVVGVEVVAHDADDLGGRQHGAEPGGVQRAPELLRRDAPAVQRVIVLQTHQILYERHAYSY